MAKGTQVRTKANTFQKRREEKCLNHEKVMLFQMRREGR